MIRTGIHFQLAVHRLTKRAFRQHAVHRFLDQALGMALTNQPCTLFPQPAFIPAMLAIDLLILFAAGQFHLRGIDDAGVYGERVDGHLG